MSEVREMIKRNPDGFSMVVQQGWEKPSMYKTLHQNKFIKKYQEVLDSYDYRVCSMYIHARIKTHGTHRIENCHGWKSNGLIFAHNGILSIANRDDMTDSETFFRDIFSPAYEVGGWDLAERTINAVIGTSKFVFMDDKGDIRHYGRYIEDDGLLFSNGTYKRFDCLYDSSWHYGYNRGYARTESKSIDWNNDFANSDFVF